MKLLRHDRWRLASKHVNGLALMGIAPNGHDKLRIVVYPNYNGNKQVNVTYWMDIAKKKYPNIKKGEVLDAMNKQIVGSFSRP